MTSAISPGFQGRAAGPVEAVLTYPLRAISNECPRADHLSLVARKAQTAAAHGAQQHSTSLANGS